MTSKRVGLAALQARESSAAKYNSLSNSLVQKRTAELKTQLEVFQNALTYFSIEHAKEIKEDPVFRREFAQMCASIGVDPLVSSNKKSSLWASVLGNEINDFYFELAVKVIEICRVTRDENGGLIAVDQVAKILSKSSITENKTSADDIERAVESLKVLGKGFGIFNIGGKRMIRSIPQELSSDQSKVIGACQAVGYVSVSILRDNLSWQRPRIVTVLDDMVSEGLLWIDNQAEETEYWLPVWTGL